MNFNNNQFYRSDYNKVPGLRSYGPNSEIKVFNLKGELLRVEPERRPKTRFGVVLRGQGR